MEDTNSKYFLKGPSVVSFPGGRTSGFMLYQVLLAHGKVLPNHVKVVFCNTGLEHGKTLDFIQACADQWGINITWLEYAGKKNKPSYKITDYKGASRKGEPFGILVDERQYLPNPIARFCTVDLKIKLLDKYMKDTYGKEFREHNQLIGLRHDEPRRVANMKKNKRKNPALLPMNEARHTLQDVMQFWSKQPFDLGIQPHHGNCQGCFLKSRYRLDLVAKEDPNSLAWWVQQEAKILGVENPKQHTFRKDRPKYENVLEQSRLQLPLFPDWDDTVSCNCTD